MNTLNKLPVVLASALVLLSASCRVFSPGPDPCVVFGLEECDRMATQQACEGEGYSQNYCYGLAHDSLWVELAGPPEEEEPLEVIVEPDEPTVTQTPTLATATPEPDVERDPLVTLQMVAHAIKTREWAWLRHMVGDEGVAITGYLYEWQQPGYNNFDEVTAFLDGAILAGSTQCHSFIVWPEDTLGATAIFSGANLTPEFGEYSADSMLVIDMRAKPGEQYDIVAIGPFTEQELGAIPGEHLDCQGNPLGVQANNGYASFDDFVQAIETLVHTPDHDLAYKLVYVAPYYWGDDRAYDAEYEEFAHDVLYFVERYEVRDISVREADTSCFPGDAVLAEHTVLLDASFYRGPICLGFAYMETGYFITEMWGFP